MMSLPIFRDICICCKHVAGLIISPPLQCLGRLLVMRAWPKFLRSCHWREGSCNQNCVIWGQNNVSASFFRWAKDKGTSIFWMIWLCKQTKVKTFFLPWLHIGIMNRQRCIFFNLLSFIGTFATCVTSHLYKIIHIQMTIDEILNFYYTEHGQTTFQTVGMVRKWKRIPCNSDQLFSQPKLTRLSARTGHSEIQMYL